MQQWYIDVQLSAPISAEAASPTFSGSRRTAMTKKFGGADIFGVQGKVIDGVLEDWRCMPRFGAHVLCGNDDSILEYCNSHHKMLRVGLNCLNDGRMRKKSRCSMPSNSLTRISKGIGTIYVKESSCLINI